MKWCDEVQRVEELRSLHIQSRLGKRYTTAGIAESLIPFVSQNQNPALFEKCLGEKNETSSAVKVVGVQAMVCSLVYDVVKKDKSL